MVGKNITERLQLLKNKSSGFILFILITIFVILLYADSPQWIENLDLKIQDMMYNFRGNLSPGDQIIIVGIDEKALENVGDWPWHRDRIADLVYSISMGQPKVIFLDFLLSPDVEEDTSGNTDVLAGLMSEVDNVIVPIYFNLSEVSLGQSQPPSWVLKSALNENPKEKPTSLSALQIFYPSEKIGFAAQDVGHMNIIRDADEVVRKEPLLVSYQGNYYPSASLQIAKNYLEAKGDQLKTENEKIILKDISIATDHKGRVLINYNGPPKTFTHISAWEVLSERVEPQIFFHKTVIVGQTSSGSAKIRTPVSEQMTSVERTANVVENIIHKNFLTPWSFWFDLLLLVLIGVFCAVVSPKVTLLHRLVILTVFFFVVINLSFILFSSAGILTKPLYPILEIFLFLLAIPAIKPQKTKKTEEEVILETEKKVAPEKEEKEPQDTTKLTIQTQENQTPTTDRVAKPSTDLVDQIVKEGKVTETKKSTTHLALTQLGRYRIIEPLGKGAMGEVYKGEDPTINRPVALKTIRLDLLGSPDEIEELKQRLIFEAQAAGRLSHTNIVTIYDVGEEGGLQYIAMEYLKGYTLDKLIKKKSELNYRIVAKILIQVCDALSYAHQHSIIHRDIKPGNIMIVDDFTVKVMDFGIARFGATSMTQAGVTVGTPSYISPEQLQGKSADKRSDIFSAGVVLYEFLTRQKPFRGEDINSLMYSILNETAAAPSAFNDKIPVIFDRIVAKATAKVPDERYQDASEISAVLKEFVSSFVVARSFKI